MGINLSRVRKFFILPIITSFLYFILYLVLIFTGLFVDHHLAFLAGVLSLFALNVVFFAVQERNQLLLVASVLIAVTAFFDLTIHQFFPHEGHDGFNVFDFLVHTLLTGGLILLSAGVFLELKTKLKQRALLDLFGYMNQLIYFQYDAKEDVCFIEFSNNFIKTYNLKYETLSMSALEFLELVHEDDRSILYDYINHEVIMDYQETEFSVKYPGMRDYIRMYSKVVEDVEDKFVTIDVDITRMTKIQETLEAQEKKLYYKALEEKYILTNTSDYIAKITPDGTFSFASPAYARIFNLTPRTIVGKNYARLNKGKNLSDENWYKTLIAKGYSADQSTLEIAGEKHYISWRNDMIKGEDGGLEAIIAIGHDITDFMTLKNTLEHRATHDDLTGLLNRRGFIEKLQQEKDTNYAILFVIDLHQFATINDYYGQDTGDKILIDIASKLKSILCPKCIAARYSGDEFGILYKDKDAIDVNKVVQRITRAVQSLYQDIEVRKNIGYSIYPDDSTSLLECLSYASMAASEVKNNKAEIAMRFEPSMREELEHNIVMANELRKAMMQDDFEVHFQPIHDVRTNAPIAFEALTRWLHKDRGIIYPQEIFQVAMDAGLSSQLDTHIIKKSLAIFSNLKTNDAYKETMLSINVTPLTLLQVNFPNRLAAWVDNASLKASEIYIEISENTFVHNIIMCEYQLNVLKKLGFSIALDDFGREYSSLSILSRVEFDIIKIDQSFIQHIDSARNQTIVKMVVDLAKVENKKVIAEGIEQKIQKDILLKLDCYLHQGFYYAHPKKMD